MTAEHIALWTLGAAILGGLMKVVFGAGKVQTAVERMSCDMVANTQATNETKSQVATIDSRVSRIEGKLGIGRE